MHTRLKTTFLLLTVATILSGCCSCPDPSPHTTVVTPRPGTTVVTPSD